MIERYGQADAVARSILKALSDEKTIVDNIVMRERRALGGSSRARSILNADRIIELHGILAGAQIRERDSAGPFGQIVPGQRISLPMRTYVYHRLQRG